MVQAGDIFTVQGYGNCNTSGATAGVERTLGAGTHYLTLTGAVSFWSGDGQNGGNTWITSMWVHDMSMGVIHGFGSGLGWQPSPAAAEATVSGIVFEFDLATTATVRFAINDGGGCADNRGSVIVDLDDLAVPTEATTWSAVKTTYR